MNHEIVAGVRRIARGFVRRNPSLYDDFHDLVQEGLIAVWNHNMPEWWPTTAKFAMIDWLRRTYGRGTSNKVHGAVTKWDSLDKETVIGGEQVAPLAETIPDDGAELDYSHVDSRVTFDQVMVYVESQCTPREIEVLQSLEKRGESKKLADKLGITEGAMTHIRKRARAKLDRILNACLV